ncbi:MAG TPA: MAPEG family protein [Burkholderiales bacterium]|nr:MAPEG family protein [Burkholderiales bacterium]
MSVTPFYAGLLAIFFFALSMRVVAVRGRVSLGDGGDPVVLRRMRGQANFAEYVPLILVMMALLEYQRAAAWQLHAIGITLVIARLLHGIALSFTPKWWFGRFFGTVLTFALLNVCGIGCVFLGLRGMGLL